jgi:hypothetical protein
VSIISKIFCAFSRKKLSLDEPISGASPGDAIESPEPLPFTPKPIMRYEDKMPILSLQTINVRPIISFIVIVYNMPEQAGKTLLSLSPAYQRGVAASDYEIIVVENISDRLLGEAAATSYAENIRYFLREEKRPTPVYAINFGAAQARGTHIAVIIDGARMCSPGVVNYMRAAATLSAHAVIAVPGYHLGPDLQQKSILQGYSEAVEAQLLNSIHWPADGYRLFEIACLSGTCSGGIFKPIGESNCIVTSRFIFEKLGGYDENFTETGGGQVNLDFYKRAVELPETTLIILLGEGSFHQIHGGVTTGLKGNEREQAMRAHFAQYGALRGEAYSPPEKRAIFLGAIPDAGLKFIQHAADVVITTNNLA